MKLQKRAYQEHGVQRLSDALRDDRRVLAVSPTGSGKTVVAAKLIRQDDAERVLWVAHRYELIGQAFKSLEALGIEAGVIMAQDERLHARGNPEARVQIASVQTLAQRGVSKDFGLVVFDEAHRVMADSYQAIANRFPPKRTRVLGLTATPVRLDGRGLGDYFRSLVVLAKPSELYKTGHLAEPKTYAAPLEVRVQMLARLKGIPSQRGDYAPSKLAAAMTTKLLVGSVVDETLRLVPSGPKVVFACSVAHSRKLVDGFKARRVRAEHLDGETDPEDREHILANLAAGRTDVVCNVDVLTEGWDLPALCGLVMARPTKSLGRYLQMTGRVQRPYKGKQPIIVDHGNNAIRHDVYPNEDVPWSLDGTTEMRNGGTPALKECVACQLVIGYGCATCPGCGAEQPVIRTEKEIVDAQLEELRRRRIEEMRPRVEEMAKRKNAPAGWTDLVLAELVA